MDKEILYNIINCGDISFKIENKWYFIGDTEKGWIASELPNSKEYGPFLEYDNLLDEYHIQGKTLREQLEYIIDW